MDALQVKHLRSISSSRKNTRQHHGHKERNTVIKTMMSSVTTGTIHQATCSYLARLMFFARQQANTAPSSCNIQRHVAQSQSDRQNVPIQLALTSCVLLLNLVSFLLVEVSNKKLPLSLGSFQGAGVTKISYRPSEQQ